MEEKRISREVELHSYLNRLILEDRDREIEKLREDKDGLDDVDDKAVAEVEKMSDVRMAELNSLFVKMDERRQVGVVTRDVFFFFYVFNETLE
jgi:STIP1 family protein 1